MLMPSHSSRRRAAGLTLIELMIAILAGLIVLGAVLTFTVATVRAYSDNIRSTRLSQELRTSMNILVRELRRSGYDSAAVTRVLTDDKPSGFDNLPDPSGTNCVVYEYDRGVAGGAPAATEVRGIRFNAATKSLQMNASSSSIDCNGGAGWVDLTDPKVVSITAFAPVMQEKRFCSVVANRDTDADGVSDQFDIAEGGVRMISLCLKGSLAFDAGVVRQVADSVRVRSDELEFLIDQDAAAKDACEALPAAAVLEPPTPEELNIECAEL